MATVQITPGQLGAVFRRTERAGKKAVMDGAYLGAQRGRTLLVEKSPVYQGQLRNAWEVHRGSQQVLLSNSAPHAGIIERGARPHAVSQEGVDAIREWVRIKVLGVSAQMADENDATVDAITWGIVKKLEREGQKGTFIVRNNLERLRGFARQEIERLMGPALSGRP